MACVAAVNHGDAGDGTSARETPERPLRRMPQPWPFFFLATFLAAFFFFFAMEMAPSNEHPNTHLTPDPQGAQHGIGRRYRRPKHHGEPRCTSDDVHVVRDAPENCQEKSVNFFPIFSRPVVEFAAARWPTVACDRGLVRSLHHGWAPQRSNVATVSDACR